jgi:LysM repeat protein
MNSPSPLVPQGAIPPKDTSRSKRVLLVGLTVVCVHVVGLSLVLLQGCGKDNGTKTVASANTDTNTPALGYPSADTNPAPNMFAPATNTAIAHANTNGPGLAPANFGTSQPAGAGAPLPGFQDPNATSLPAPDQSTTVAGPTRDYKIQKGDLLTTIAKKNGVTLSAILKANPNLDPKKLKVGQTIKIPAAAPAATAVAAAGTGSTPPTGATGTTAGAATGVGTYKVKAGDTLTRIAKAHGVTVNQLRAANNMKTMQVQVGKVLKIPARTQRTAAAPTNSTTAQ